MPAWLPEWLLKFILQLIIGALTKKVGELGAAKHVEAAMAKAVPLPVNPTPADERNPNKKGHYGGL